MTSEQEIQVHAAIHTASAAAAAVGAGLAQLPCADNVALAGIQTTMIVAIGAAFGKSIQRSTAEGIAAGQIGTIVGRGISQALLGWIPGVGNAINATTAAGVTESLGWAVAKQFDMENG